MNFLKRKILILSFALIIASTAMAESQSLRWTANEDKNPTIEHVIQLLRAQTGYPFEATDFRLTEDRDLARQHFSMFTQVSGGLPIRSRSIRIWADRVTHETVQIEALVENPTRANQRILQFTRPGLSVSSIRTSLSAPKTMKLVNEALAQTDDRQIRNIAWTDAWDPTQKSDPLVRIIKVKARRGTHTMMVSLVRHRMLSTTYEEYPRSEFSIPAQVFPIYEEVESTGELTQRVPAELRYLNTLVPVTDRDPYAVLATRRYPEAMYDPLLGETEEGRAQGYWAMSYIKRQAAAIHQNLAVANNSFTHGGVLLNGRYATVSLHPDVVSKFQGLQFQPRHSATFKPQWALFNNNGYEGYEMIPMGSLLGRPIASLEDGWNRPARRLADHNTTHYINDGFDEIQVYYAINALFDSLRPMGFTDPELSTRPFHAFLYDPDLEMRDNAFYTDDTINFTTYSPKSPNYARDNPTIWHELGHGIMDRLMGDSIRLADTGGLGEGIADLIADLVIQDVTKGEKFPGSEQFRIINKTGFFLTNEVHDDGEAYGGAMKDFLSLVIKHHGRAGLTKVTDLVLESMRLCRNHPGLTAADWFSHMLFADQLGNPGVRAAGELGGLLTRALDDRNFDLAGGKVAHLLVKNEGSEVLSHGPGSRGNPIPVSLSPEEEAPFQLAVSVANGDRYKFRFPVTVKVDFKTGALQGAVHWKGEEKGPLVFTLNSENDTIPIELQVAGTCDFTNREDGSCVDYAYIQIWNEGENEKPQAKKRFYVRMSPRGQR